MFEDAFFYESFTAAQVGRSLGGVFGARWNADSLCRVSAALWAGRRQKLKEYSRGMRLKLSLLPHWPMTLSCWCWTRPPPVLTPVVAR